MVAWIRLIGGLLLVFVGAVWIGQGVGLIKGSGMSGHGQYAVAGIVVALCGLWLLWSPVLARTRAMRAH